MSPKPSDDSSEQSLDTNEISVTPDINSLRSYYFFFSGQMISLLGSNVVQFGIIFWITFTSLNDPDLTDKTGLILGIASFLGFAPMVVTGLFAGVLIDRWNRKFVIGVVDFLQAFFTGILMVLFWLNIGNLYHVLIILTIRSTANGFHGPAVQAIIPLMVPREKLTSVNSMEWLFGSSIFMIGPLLGALIIGIFGVENLEAVLIIDLLTFLAALIPLILIKIPDITKSKREAGEKQSFKEEFSEGINFVREGDGLISLLTTFTIANIVTVPMFTLLPLIVIDPELINGDEATLGYAMAVGAFGQIILSAYLTKRKMFAKNVKGVGIGQVLFYIGQFIVGVSALLGSIPGLLIGMFIDGVGAVIANVHSQTIWQSVVPPELQGRVMSVRSTIAWIFNPIAMLSAGFLADLIGAGAVLIGGVGIGLIFLTYAWYLTELPNIDTKLGIFEQTTGDTVKTNTEESTQT